MTLRRRKKDSNSRSLRAGKGYGKHCRFGPEPVSGSAFRAAVSDWQSPEEPFAGAGPMVRIRFPPAASQAKAMPDGVAREVTLRGDAECRIRACPPPKYREEITLSSRVEKISLAFVKR